MTFDKQMAVHTRRIPSETGFKNAYYNNNVVSECKILFNIMRQLIKLFLSTVYFFFRLRFLFLWVSPLVCSQRSTRSNDVNTHTPLGERWENNMRKKTKKRSEKEAKKQQQHLFHINSEKIWHMERYTSKYILEQENSERRRRFFNAE